MSLEYLEKYNSAERKSTHSTINDPVVVFLGLTMMDLGVALVTFLVMAMILDSPFVGLGSGILAAYLKKSYARKFTKGALTHWLWSHGWLKKKNVPMLFERNSSQTIFSP